MRFRVVIALTLAAVALSPRAILGVGSSFVDECSTDPRNTVVRSMDLTRARDWATAFPSERRRAPELETDAPAHIFIFRPPFYGGFGNVYQSSVVCVVQENNDPMTRVNLYPFVDLKGVTD